MIDVTPEQVREAALAADRVRIDHHDCSICGHMVHFIVTDGELFFDPRCDCIRGGSVKKVGWEAGAKFINLQDIPHVRVELARRFGLKAEDVGVVHCTCGNPCDRDVEVCPQCEKPRHFTWTCQWCGATHDQDTPGCPCNGRPVDGTPECSN